MHKVFLGIGGNVGNKQKNFNEALILIEKHLGKVLKISSIYETPPWGFKAEENFWNEVIMIETDRSAHNLISEIHIVEQHFGRQREADSRYSSREMDIDILYFDEEHIENAQLTVPHPRIAQRKFVLVPLVEIAPDFVHPLLHQSNFQLLEHCKDESMIKRVKKTN